MINIFDQLTAHPVKPVRAGAARPEVGLEVRRITSHRRKPRVYSKASSSILPKGGIEHDLARFSNGSSTTGGEKHTVVDYTIEATTKSRLLRQSQSLTPLLDWQDQDRLPSPSLTTEPPNGGSKLDDTHDENDSRSSTSFDFDSSAIFPGNSGARTDDSATEQSDASDNDDLYDDSTSLDEQPGNGGLDTMENDVSLTVHTILPILLEPSNGCSAEDHAAWRLTHNQQSNNNHNGLSHTYASDVSGFRLKNPNIGLAKKTFPELGNPRAAYTDAETFSALFEGTTSTDVAEQQIKQICLHVEDYQEQPAYAPSERLASVTYDFDSILVIPTTWNAFRNGFRWAPAYNKTLQIKTNLHVKRRVKVEDLQGNVTHQSLHFRDIPHLYLGSVDGFHHSSLYIFFPRLINKDPQKRFFHFLTDEQVRTFTDKVFIPIYEEFHTNDQIQHIPATQSIAEGKAQARSREHQRPNGERFYKTHTTFPVFHHTQVDSWEALQVRINSAPEFSRFQDAFLLMDAKGLKLDYKHNGGLYPAMTTFQEYLGKHINTALTEDVVVDIGREVCEVKSQHADNEILGLAPPPATYLNRTCCLEKEYNYLRRSGGPFNGEAGSVTFYHNGTLEDAKNMTLTPPKRSQVGRYWHYMHRYNSIKLAGDAQTVFLMSNPAFKDLAVDAGIWAARSNTGATGTALQRYCTLKQNYKESKARTHETYNACAKTSYGTRVEVRISWKVFQAMLRQLEEDDLTSAAVGGLVIERPRSMWAVSTEQYCSFMRGNYDKKLTLLETAIATSERTGITRETTMFVATVMKDVQRFNNSNLGREKVLWLDSRTSLASHGQETVERGLGFERTCIQQRYGWWTPGLVDWSKLYFLPEYTKQMYGWDRGLRGTPTGQGRQAQDARQQMDVCFERLREPDLSATEKEEATTALVHICLRQFRGDVLLALKQRGDTLDANTCSEDSVRFDHTGIWTALGVPPYRVTHNRTQYKNPVELWQLIWGTEKSTWPRTHFSDKPYRNYARICREFFLNRGNDLAYFDDLLLSLFWIWHPLCPYPSAAGTLISTKTGKGKGERQWWSVWKVQAQWRWDQTEGVPVASTPVEYPPTLDMSAVELQRHFRR